MLAWIKALLPTAGGIAGVLSWWKVAAVALGVLTVSNLGTAFYSYNAGWTNADNASKAALVKAQGEHTTWLLYMGKASGVLTQDDAVIELTNEELEGAIYAVISNTVLGAGECMSSEFLRGLAKLR